MGRVRPMLVVLATFLPGAVLAADQAALETQVESLTQRVAYLERKLEQLLAERETPDAPAPKVRNLRESSFSIGGRVKLDVLGNSASVGGIGGRNRSDVGFVPYDIPLDDTGEDNQLSANARDSRIWINASTPTQTSELGAFLEFDFGSFDNSGTERISNSHNPRVRHAYATYQNFTVGQTTTTFDNAAAFPELNDSGGPVGVLTLRQPLIRYSWENNRFRWSVAAEQPESTVTAANGERLVFDDDRMPDLVARVDYASADSELTLAMLFRNIRADDIIQDSTYGAGLSVAGRRYLHGADNLRFAFAWGKGIGRYVSYNAFDDAVISFDQELEAIPVRSAFVAYQHWWSKRWRSNLAVGHARADLDRRNYTTGLLDERFWSAHLNLLWSPIPSATFGVEWLYGRRELLNDVSASLNRVQFSSLYKFRQ